MSMMSEWTKLYTERLTEHHGIVHDRAHEMSRTAEYQDNRDRHAHELADEHAEVEKAKGRV